MGLKSYLQGHGWDGTQETPAEQHTKAMQEQVAAWKEKYAEPEQTTGMPTRLTNQELVQRWYGHDPVAYQRSGERHGAEESRQDIARTVRTFAEDMQATRRVLQIHDNEVGHRKEMDSGYRPQTPIVTQTEHVLNVYHERGLGDVTEQMRTHGQLRKAWAEQEHQGRTVGYDGPDDVRMPRELGPREGTRDAAAIEARFEANRARKEQAQQHGHDGGMEI